TTKARENLRSVMARPEYEVQRQRSDTPGDPVERLADPAGLMLVKPEANHVANDVVSTPWRPFIKGEADRTEPVKPRYRPGVAAYIVTDHAVMYDVAGEAMLPGTVAVLDLGRVEDIIRRRQTDLPNRRHAEERA